MVETRDAVPLTLPGQWQARTIARLSALGFGGFAFGPGRNWWPIERGSGRKVAGPFTSMAEFDRWLDANERGRQRPRLAARSYGGWKAAAQYYEDRMLSAPTPDHPVALDAWRGLVNAEANMIGWASRTS